MKRGIAFTTIALLVIALIVVGSVSLFFLGAMSRGTNIFDKYFNVANQTNISLPGGEKPKPEKYIVYDNLAVSCKRCKAGYINCEKITSYDYRIPYNKSKEGCPSSGGKLYSVGTSVCIYKYGCSYSYSCYGTYYTCKKYESDDEIHFKWEK